MTSSPRRRTAGMTLLEVVLAVAVIGIVVATLTTALVDNVNRTKRFGTRSEAAQLLNYFGRRVAGGDDAVLPAADAQLAWDYGDLGGAFPDLAHASGFVDPARYRVSIASSATVTLGSAEARRYDVSVCFRDGGSESCAAGTTFGPEPAAGGTAATLPGIN